MYSCCYASFGLLALLASNAFATPHDEDAPNNSTAISTTSRSSKRTKTVLITVTVTDEPSIATFLPSDKPTYTSLFDIPRPPDPLDPTGTQPTLICPHPTEPCTISGIPIWPSGTTSLVLASFTYGPLPTSMILRGGKSTIPTETLGTSGSPTSASTTCSHSMSHLVFGKSKQPAVEPPCINATMPVTSISGISIETSMNLNTTCSHSISHIVPGKSDVPDPPVLTEISTPGPPSKVSTSVSAGISIESPVPQDSATPGSTSSDNTPSTSTASPSAIPTDNSSTSMNTSTTCSHSMTHIVPNTYSASPPSLASNDRSWSMLPVNLILTHTPVLPLPTYPYPPGPSKEYYKARNIHPQPSTATTLTWITPKLVKHTRNRRAEESKAEPRRSTYWSRFFAAAEKERECLACDEEGAVACLEKGRYTWCKDGCVRVMKLGCDMVCKEGVKCCG